MSLIVLLFPKSINNLFFQVCREGHCVPFYPKNFDPDENAVDDNAIDDDKEVDVKDKPQFDDYPNVLNDVFNELTDHDRPVWYDEIFARIFSDLDRK